MNQPMFPLLTRTVLLAALAITMNAHAQPTLKDAFKQEFLIGAALNPSQFARGNNCETALVAEHFNSISPENVLKWAPIHPEEDRYNFGPADQFVDYGIRHGMVIVAHTLVWHHQTPRWVFQGADGKPVDRDTLLQRMKDHISTVVGRYKGKIAAWDVVNEALDENGALRQSQWLKIIGEDYILKAYQFAQEADPAAELYYNDFSLENAPKRKGAVALIRKLQSQGVRIAAVGLQGHYKMDWPKPRVLDRTIKDFAALGVKVSVTELDMDVLPAATSSNAAEVGLRFTSRAQLNPYTNGLPNSVQKHLAKRYAELFRVFVNNRDSVDRVTFWGVSDKSSWLNNWPVPGRTSYPLLFDRNCAPKPAFDAVLKTAPRR